MACVRFQPRLTRFFHGQGLGLGRMGPRPVWLAVARAVPSRRGENSSPSALPDCQVPAAQLCSLAGLCLRRAWAEHFARAPGVAAGDEAEGGRHLRVCVEEARLKAIPFPSGHVWARPLPLPSSLPTVGLYRVLVYARVGERRVVRSALRQGL